MLSVQSDDPDIAVLNIQINGTGLSPGGDVNHDGGIDLKDALLSLKICVGFIPAADRTCDINGDGRIGLHEAVNALQYSSGLKDSLASELSIQI